MSILGENESERGAAMKAVHADFQEVYELYRPKIVGYLRRLVGETEAEDVAQEVFLKVSRSLDEFRGESQLSTWIYRIATNAALDRWKSRSRREKLSDDASADDKTEVEDKDAWTGEKKPSLETSLIRKEMNECIRNIVDNLPLDYRTVMVLSEVEGFTNKEIAEIAGVSLETVKIRLHRARARLKKEMEFHCNFFRDERNELGCDRKMPSLKFLKK